MTEDKQLRPIRQVTMMSEKEVKDIENWMFDTRFSTTMGKAVRELIRRGLTVEEGKE